MELLGEVSQWIQAVIVNMVELLPFIENGEVLLEKATSWFLVGGVGGALSTAPLYQVLLTRYTVRHAKRIVRRILRLGITIVLIGLALKFLGI